MSRSFVHIYIIYDCRTFQFGWIGSPDLANSIAMMRVPLPYLIVLNSTTGHHHVPDDEPHQLTPEAITIFLESVQNQSARVSNSLKLRIFFSYKILKYFFSNH